MGDNFILGSPGATGSCHSGVQERGPGRAHNDASRNRAPRARLGERRIDDDLPAWKADGFPSFLRGTRQTLRPDRLVVTASPLQTMASLTEAQVRRKPLVVIMGPTAVGKSRLAIEVAKRLDSEILTVDSRQVYRGMDVGTDKPPVAARHGVAHHLLDLVDPDEPFNAGLFRRHATQVIDELYRRRRLPLVVGGTGLYVRILLQGLCEAPASDPGVRAQLCEEAREQGPDHLYARLASVDPVTAAKLHPRDTSKIIRALEVHHLSGVPLSSFQAGHGFIERPFS